MNVKIPVFRIATLAGSFYVGYNEGKGIDVRDFVEYAALYGPTAYAAVSTPLFLLGTKKLNRWMKRFSQQQFISGYGRPREFWSHGGDSISTGQYQRSVEVLDGQYESLNKKSPVESAIKSGVFAAGLTAIGYTTGKLCAQLF